MYVRLREGVAQSLNAIGLDRMAHLNHSYAHALGQQSEPTARAGTKTSKCDDVVGNPVILDTFDVRDYRLKPRPYDLLLELAPQVVSKASSAGGLLLLIEGHADDTVKPFMNIGLSFNHATEDIQTAQGIHSLRDRWQAYKEYVPVAHQFLRIFTPVQTHSSGKESYVNNALNSNPSKYEQDDDAVS